MARPSRPPGFDMTYRPMAEFFGPPFAMRLGALVHGGLALLIFLIIFLAQKGLLGSGLFNYLFRQRHLMDPYAAASFFALSALLSIIRDSMKGVQVRPNWIEYRQMLNAVWPSVRRYRWAQIDSVIFEQDGAIGLDLWDGSRHYLPPVRAKEELRRVLAQLAKARAIPVEGDVPDDGGYEDAA